MINNSTKTQENNVVQKIAIPLFFIFGAFLIFLPVTDRYFVSDDFKVLKRVCMEQTIVIKHFFRPLSDLSIYLNYQLGGLNPVSFNLFGILVHGINSWLLYLVCRSVVDLNNNGLGKQFAFISGVIFLTYPFHNEGVVWLLGRGASMACLFSLLSIISFYRIDNPAVKRLCVCLFYFIGIASFESTLLFPIIFLLILKLKKEPKQSIHSWNWLLLMTLAVHLWIRYYISGSLLGSYGGEFFGSGFRRYFLNIPKVAVRLILPPSGSTIIPTVVLALASFFAIYFRKSIFRNLPDRITRSLLFLFIMMAIASIIPIVTGVSTVTSETDRTLYFPSLFFCMIEGLMITYCIDSKKIKYTMISMILVFNIFFLEINNRNWVKASNVTKSVMDTIRQITLEDGVGKVYFLNIPNEMDGAYVFRQGFQDALRLNQFNTEQFIDVNYLPRQDLKKITNRIIINNKSDSILLGPDIILIRLHSGCLQIVDHRRAVFSTGSSDQIYFWNFDQLEKIQTCSPSGPA